MLRTTLGRMLVNDALPDDLRDHARVLDKKGLLELMRQVAIKHPDRYVEISKRLADIGRESSTEGGGNSFGLRHMRKAKAFVAAQKVLDSKLERILDDDSLDDKKRNELIIKSVGAMQAGVMDDILKESLEEENPLAFQVISGARGNKMNLASLRGSDMLYTDHRDEVIPLPVRRSYSQGLSPIEYWAGTYGARRGTLATKFATRDAGYLSKNLNQVAHRLVVVDEDYDDPEQQKILRGVPVDVNDMDNEGALLANDIGDYRRNTVLTPKIMKDLERRGIKRLLIRSPMVGGSPEGGVYARDVGVRERGVLPGRGEQVGLTAAQGLSEPISQGQLSAKHSGGVAGQEKAVSGFQAIEQLIQVPKQFKGVAAHSTEDGHVDRIEPAPAGGYYVYVNGKQHYVAAGYDLKVKPGDEVEAGDVLSNGVPHPAVVVQHKGIGEGRRYFVKAMRDAMLGSGMKAHRRNIEILARGLINHVRLTDEWGDYVPDDVVPYSTLEHTYQPREGAKILDPRRAVGKYLERPVLHYTIGTKVRPSMLKDFEEFGVKNLDVHADPAPFQPEMIRGMASLQHDPDWITRMYGSGLKSSVLDAVQRGASSNELGTSFVPGLARAVDFGRQGLVRPPEPGTKPEEDMPKRTVKPQQLDLASIPKLPPPKPSGSMFNLFKLSSEARALEEARALLEKVASQSQSSVVKTAIGRDVDNLRPVRPATAQIQQPQAQPAVPKPPTQPSQQTPVPQVQAPQAFKPTQQPMQPQPTASPAQTQQAQWGAWASMRAGGQPQAQAQNPAMPWAGGYRPGMGMLGPHDQPEDFARFVAGNDQLDHDAGYGGFVGALTRFGSGLDGNAVAALTGQSPYVRGQYGAGSSQATGMPFAPWMAGTGNAAYPYIQNRQAMPQAAQPGYGYAQGAAARTPSPTAKPAVSATAQTASPAAQQQSWLGSAGRFAGEALGVLPEAQQRSLAESAAKLPFAYATYYGAIPAAIDAANKGVRHLIGAAPPVAAAAGKAGLLGNVARGVRGGVRFGYGIDALMNAPAVVGGWRDAFTGEHNAARWKQYTNYADSFAKKNILEQINDGLMPIRPATGLTYQLTDGLIDQMEASNSGQRFMDKRWGRVIGEINRLKAIPPEKRTPGEQADLDKWQSERYAPNGEGFSNSIWGKTLSGDLIGGYDTGSGHRAVYEGQLANRPESLLRSLFLKQPLTPHQQQRAETYLKDTMELPSTSMPIQEQFESGKHSIDALTTALIHAPADRRAAISAALQAHQARLAVVREHLKTQKAMRETMRSTPPGAYSGLVKPVPGPHVPFGMNHGSSPGGLPPMPKPTVPVPDPVHPNY